MGLDMSLYRIPKTEYPLNMVLSANDFVRYVCDEDFSELFKVWYEEHSDHLPSMKTIYDLAKLCPDYIFIKEVGYWRKANAIHKWFVDNVQDGQDDCQFHRPVTKEDLETLKGLCKAVLDDHSKAEKLLPTMPGFFFGTYDYDEIYFEKIQCTHDLCKKLIEEFDFENYELYYASSW